MFRNISLLAVLFAVIASLSGEADRITNGPAVIHSLTAASLFDPSQTWVLVHYYSLALVLLLAFGAGGLVLRCSPVNWPALRASALLSLISVSLLVFDSFRAAAQTRQLAAVTHLLLGNALVWCAFWMLLQYRRRRVQYVPQGILRQSAGVLMAALLIVLASGAWTSINNAGLACPDFMQCVGIWRAEFNLPELLDDFRALFQGQLALTPDSLSSINVWHHVLAGATAVLILLWLLYGLFSKQALAVRIAFFSLVALVSLEIGLGIFAIHSGLSLWVVLVHSNFAGLLMLPLIAIRFFSRYEYLEEKPTLTEFAPEVELEQAAGIEDKALYKEPAPESLYLRLKSQLKKTRTGLGQALAGLSFGSGKAGADLLEELETSLILADVGMDATNTIINRLKNNVERDQLNNAEVLLATLKQEMLEMLQPCSQPLVIPKQDKPYVILVVGINGVGKTTTIGKMAKRLQAQGHSVMLAAGDTFRAAAVEQLQIWGERNHIHVVAQHTGADSASVIYDGIQSALAKGVDVLIADTAGRLHTKSNLMDELKKVKRIMAKLDETAPHEVLLVLDAGTGQNAISQTGLFNETVGLTGLVLTKLDGTAKGGILLALANQFGIPIRYIGIGEGIDDLQDFDAQNFIDALFVKDD